MPVYKDEKYNTYYCKFYYTDWTGSRKQKMKRGFKLKRDALQFERDFIEKYAISPNISFKTLYERFMAESKNKVSTSTFYTRGLSADKYILPFFGKMIVSDITPQHVIEWQNSMYDHELAPNYLRLINTLLKQIFDYAVKFMKLPENPVKSQISKRENKKIDFWTPEEYKKFSECIKDKKELHLAFQIMYFTGIRKGELLALTPQDIDTTNETIHINKTYIYVNKKAEIHPPKTKKSNRIIKIPSFIAREIEEYYKCIYDIPLNARIFQHSISWLGYNIDKYSKIADIKRIRVHDIRHSHASCLIDLGANPLLIADRLGHEDVTLTMNIYSHLFESHQQEIVEKLNNLGF